MFNKLLRTFSMHYRPVRRASIMSSLKQRGVISKIIPEDVAADVEKTFSSPQCIYCGFDPTAESLHVGHLAPLLLLFRMQRSGHRPLVLLGSATAYIGDPSGKSTGRPLLSPEVIDNNIRLIRRQIERISHYHEKYFSSASPMLPKLSILENIGWYGQKGVIEFLTETKGLVHMADLLKKDSIKERLKNGQSLSYAEFSYQIFQGFDWLHLYRHHGCKLQIGGHDQLGNIMTGYEMIKRATKARVFGVTVPLIKSSTGDKLGKTAGNAVWLDASKTPPFELFQYFFRFSDNEVPELLRLFTFMTENEIQDILSIHNRRPELRKAQRHLAKYVTKLIHGESGVDSAITCSEVLFNRSSTSLASLTLEEVNHLFNSIPRIDIEMSPEMTVLELANRAGCFSDLRTAENAIRGGGFSINFRKVINPNQCLIMGEHILPRNNISLLRVGKKNYYVISWHS